MTELPESLYDDFISQLSLENISRFRKECLLNSQDLFAKVNNILIPKHVYQLAMNTVFNISSTTLFTLIFDRFKSIECTIESNNPKSIAFSLKEIIPTEDIDLYSITCALVAFAKYSLRDKMKFLFEITDLDDDGLINEREITKMIYSISLLFCKEESQINIDSRLIYQSLGYIKTNRIYQMLMKHPGELSTVLAVEHFISFNQFQSAIDKINRYKYELIPFYSNLKQCLSDNRTEKSIKLKKSVSEEFIAISNELIPSDNLVSKKDLRKTTSVVEFKNFMKKIQFKKRREGMINKAEISRFNRTSSQFRKIDYSKLINLDVPPVKIQVINESEQKDKDSKNSSKIMLPRVGSMISFRLNKANNNDSVNQLKTYGDITNEINNILLKHSNEGKHINEIVKMRKKLHNDAGEIKRFLSEKENYFNLKFSVLYAYMVKKDSK